ncbi:MAG: outer membrane protein transport protein [SAR324 cluster bacterium]|nr:outer membrane protein transport protein [SAR324 cluster bacterium]
MKILGNWKFQFALMGSFLLLLPAAIFATNGMKVIGVGTKQRSMGGASVGLPLDAAVTLTNPAGMVLLKSQVNFGGALFTPKSTLDKVEGCFDPTGQGCGFPPFNNDTKGKDSEMGTSPMPAFGMILPGDRDDLKWGIAGYGVAGMGVDYPGEAIYRQPGYSNFSMMKFSAPSVAMKFGDLAFGFAYNLNWATMGFQAAGLQSANAQGKLGSGFVLGTLYSSGAYSLGLAYESKQDFPDFEFNGYGCPNGFQSNPSSTGPATDCVSLSTGTATAKTQVSGKLEFDQPPVLTGGFGYTRGALKIAFDISQIKWSETTGKDQPKSTYANYTWNMNWSDQTVYKLGVQYEVSSIFVLRGGYNRGDDPTDHKRAFETLMFPAIVEDHYTMGGSYQFSKKTSLDFGYMMVPQKTVTGKNMLQGISDYETSLSETSIDLGLTSYF